MQVMMLSVPVSINWGDYGSAPATSSRFGSRRAGSRPHASTMSDRRALLAAALGFLQLRQDPPEVAAFRRWLDSWRGLGDVVRGLNAQGLDLELRQFPPAERRRSSAVVNNGAGHHRIGYAWRHGCS